MSDSHGRFIWYELLTRDVEAAQRFYGGVAGWTFQSTPLGGGAYTIIQAAGAGLGGMMAMPAELTERGVPPHWSGYICVDDTDAAAAKVERLGGSVKHPPQDIPGVGRFAVVSDPHGAVFEVMTPLPMDPAPTRPPQGTEGHIAWHELYAGDLEQAFAFYAEMFGWKKDEALDMGPMGTYQLFSNQDGQIGGMMTKPAQMPWPAWAYYVQVGDIDAAKARVEAAGGQVLMGPAEVPGGAWIVQGLDPQGANFALVGRRS